MKQKLGFAEGVLKGMAQQNTGGSKVFDWDKCAEILKEKKATENKSTVYAGLAEDWSWTADTIMSEGVPLGDDDIFAYLASSWATPILDIDGEEIECWTYLDENTRFRADSTWDEKSLEILNNNN